jgi:transcriptional regulator with XRE-family HTH domain
MQSLQKTPVARLRQKLGLSVEAFAELIDKSYSTVTKLEVGILKLSAETAHQITEETGTALEWILDASPEEEPYWIDPADNRKRPWTKQIFEQIQAYKLEPHPPFKDPRPAWRLVRAMMATGRWLSIYSWAEKNGQTEVAQYLITKFLNGLAERLGTDDVGATRLCQNAELRLKDGTQWTFEPEEGQLHLKLDPKSIERRKPKDSRNG